MPIGAPTISLSSNRQEGRYRDTLGTLHIGDVIELTCTVPSGAVDPVQYEWTCTSSIAGTLTWTTNAPLSYLGVSGSGLGEPSGNAGLTTLTGAGHVAGEVFTGIKVRARNVPGSFGSYSGTTTATARTFSVATTSDLTAPTVTAALAVGISGVTVTFDLTSSNQREYLVTAGIYHATDLLGSASVFALRGYGTGVTLDVPVDLLPGDTHTVKMSVTAFKTTDGTILTKTSGTTLTFDAPGFLLSPNTGRAITGQDFSLELHPGNDAALLAPIGFPAGLMLTTKSGTDNQHLIGRVDVPGVYVLSILDTIDPDSDTVTFTLTVGEAFDAPALIEAWQLDRLLTIVKYLGTSTVTTWYLTNAPTGVEIGTVSISGGSGDIAAENIAAISGAAASAGVFDATLSALVMIDGLPFIYSQPIRFEISGGLFLNWLQDDPTRRDLQLMWRDKSVHGYLLGDALTLKQDDDEKLHVVFRDGPVSSDNFGRVFIEDNITSLRLLVRPSDNYDAVPLLEIGGAVVIETIAEHAVCTLTFTVEGEEIERRFAALDTAPGADSAQVSLDGMGELEWTRDGRTQRGQIFAVKILQAADR